MDNTVPASDYSNLMLHALRIVAVRVDDDLMVEEVNGSAIPVPLGTDVRETMPALYGLEDILSAAQPDFTMPYLQPGNGLDRPVTVTAQRDGAGVLWLFIRDVSEESVLQQQLVQNHNSLSLAQSQLVKARDTAQQADHAKTAFLANVSHELRTPLHVIIGGASILMKPREKPLSGEDISGYAADIHDSGVLLLQLVDDLIDLSRSETGDLTLYEEWCDLSDLMTGMVALCRELPQAADVEIDCRTMCGRCRIYADARRIKQILLNLISNAAKATSGRQDAHITVAVEQREGRCCLIVRDNGPGMSDADLAIARQPFGQPRAAVRSKGTGLGLAIVDNLARLHGGMLDIETAPGEGLTATVSFDPERFKVD